MNQYADPELVVLSAGRSGSKYIQRVLKQCGIDCGHEAVASRDHAWRPTGVVAESSWLALPYVEDKWFKGAVVHQLRDPLTVIASYLANGIAPEYAGFAMEHLYREDFEPLISDAAALRFFTYYVREWNTRCAEEAYKRGGFSYRVEAMNNDDLALMLTLGGLRQKVTVSGLSLARQRVPVNTNHQKQVRTLTWQDLPRGNDTEWLYHAATEEWGYEYARQD